MSRTLYTKGFQEQLALIRKDIQKFYPLYKGQIDMFNEEVEKLVDEIKDPKRLSDEIKELESMLSSQDQLIELVSKEINEERMYALRDTGLPRKLLESAESTLKKYLGVKASPRVERIKIGDYQFDKNGRIAKLVKIFEKNSPDKRKIGNIAFGLKLRVQNKVTSQILMSDKGTVEEYCSEERLWKLINSPNEFKNLWPWDGLSSDEKKDPRKYYDFLSASNVIKLYAEDNPNEILVWLESRVKGHTSLSSKILENVMLVLKEKDVVYPVDISGLLMKGPLWLLYPATRAIVGTNEVKKVNAEYSYAFHKYNFKDFEVLRDYNFLKGLYNKARKIDEDYIRVIESQSKWNKKSKKRSRKRIAEELLVKEDKLKKDKNQLLIFSKPLIQTHDGLYIRHADFIPEWKDLYDNSKLVDHDNVYAKERREKMVKDMKYYRLDKFIPYLHNLFKIPFGQKAFES